MTQQKINIKLLPVKAHYFFFNAAASTLWPFLPLIGKQLGVSSEATGIVFGIGPTIAMCFKPIVGVVADRLRKRKHILLFFLILALTSSLALAFLPQKEPSRPVIFECGNLGTNYILQFGRHPHIMQEEVDETLFKLKNKANYTDQIQNPSSSTNVILRPGEELCNVKCEIHSFIEGSDFCDNLNMPAEFLPQRCRGRKQQKNFTFIPNAETTALPASLDVPYTYLLGPSSDSDAANHPYTLKFDVVLKLESTVLLNGSLFLHVDRLSFYPDTGNFSQFSCNPDKASLRNCFMECGSHPDLNTYIERVLEETDFSESSSFWLYGVLVIIAFTTLGVCTSLSDALCFQMLGTKPQLYGMQRQWGAVGWGIFTLVTGYFIDTNSKGKLLKDYTPCFYLLGCLFPLDILTVYKLDVKEMDKPKQIRRDLWILVTDLRVIIFGFACFIVGMNTGMLWNFLFWHIEDIAVDKRWIKVLLGLIVAIQCASELPFFHFAGWFIKKLGYIHCMTLVLLCFGIRFLLYSVINLPWLFLPVELFQGITYGIFYSIMTSYASFIAPPGASSTVQGLIGAVFEGIGVAAGSLVGGLLMNTWGGSIAFRLFGFGSLIFCLLHAILSFLLARMRSYVGGDMSQQEEGEEMYKVNGVSQDVEGESE